VDSRVQVELEEHRDDSTGQSWMNSGNNTDLYINKLDAGLATLSIAKGDSFKLTSPAQHALRG